MQIPILVGAKVNAIIEFLRIYIDKGYLDAAFINESDNEKLKIIKIFRNRKEDVHIVF